jgi:hypothetical protein
MGDVRVGHLLVGQDDVQADGERTGLAGPAVGRLHDAGPAPGRHHAAAVVRVLADQPPEAPRLLVVPAVGEPAFGRLHRAPGLGVARGGARPGPRRFQLRPGGVGVGDAGAAVNDDRRLDVVLLQDELGLEQLELQPHGAQLVAQQELGVLEGQPVAGRAAVLGDGGFRGPARVLVRRGEDSPAGGVRDHVGVLLLALLYCRGGRIVKWAEGLQVSTEGPYTSVFRR